MAIIDTSTTPGVHSGLNHPRRCGAPVEPRIWPRYEWCTVISLNIVSTIMLFLFTQHKQRSQAQSLGL